MKEAIERVQHMEQCFDTLQQMAAENPNAIDKALLGALRAYYEGGQWLRDYTLEEQGSFPSDLKRGVLSQDAVYDFLEKYDL